MALFGQHVCDPDLWALSLYNCFSRTILTRCGGCWWSCRDCKEHVSHQWQGSIVCAHPFAAFQHRPAEYCSEETQHGGYFDGALWLTYIVVVPSWNLFHRILLGFRSMELEQVALCFADAQHAGDRRKRSQLCVSPFLLCLCFRHPRVPLCVHSWAKFSSGYIAVSNVHKQWGFQRSQAYTGTLGPIHRARVNELWSDDVERPPNPPQRVLWFFLISFLECCGCFIFDIEISDKLFCNTNDVLSWWAPLLVYIVT